MPVVVEDVGQLISGTVRWLENSLVGAVGAQVKQVRYDADVVARQALAGIALGDAGGSGRGCLCLGRGGTEDRWVCCSKGVVSRSGRFA